jgi:hypothetical protein
VLLALHNVTLLVTTTSLTTVQAAVAAAQSSDSWDPGMPGTMVIGKVWNGTGEAGLGFSTGYRPVKGHVGQQADPQGSYAAVCATGFYLDQHFALVSTNALHMSHPTSLPFVQVEPGRLLVLQQLRAPRITAHNVTLVAAEGMLELDRAAGATQLPNANDGRAQGATPSASVSGDGVSNSTQPSRAGAATRRSLIDAPVNQSINISGWTGCIHVPPSVDHARPSVMHAILIG